MQRTIFKCNSQGYDTGVSLSPADLSCVTTGIQTSSLAVGRPGNGVNGRRPANHVIFPEYRAPDPATPFLVYGHGTARLALEGPPTLPQSIYPAPRLGSGYVPSTGLLTRQPVDGVYATVGSVSIAGGDASGSWSGLRDASVR